MTDKTPNKRLYDWYAEMKLKCTNPTNKDYDFYKGMFHKPWLDSYAVFQRWAYDRGYDGSELPKRIHADKPFEPGNLIIGVVNVEMLGNMAKQRRQKTNVDYHKGHNYKAGTKEAASYNLCKDILDATVMTEKEKFNVTQKVKGKKIWNFKKKTNNKGGRKRTELDHIDISVRDAGIYFKDIKDLKNFDI
jgi:hypothetical protein